MTNASIFGKLNIITTDDRKFALNMYTVARCINDVYIKCADVDADIKKNVAERFEPLKHLLWKEVLSMFNRPSVINIRRDDLCDVSIVIVDTDDIDA
jgi:hypothetical protein